jgi:hypothetical protein
MARKINYWLARKLDRLPWLTTEYYCIDPTTHEASTTTNPKHAMRWHTQEGAEQFAATLGWQWTAEEHTFDGSEMAG